MLLSEERKLRILELVDVAGTVKVSTLAKSFNVSTETIRRDLEELEATRKLKKVYGGAVKVQSPKEELPLFAREVLQITEKEQIGACAATFVKDGDVIFVDEGTTTLQMLPTLLRMQQLTVITNSFPLVFKLMEYEQQQLFIGQVIFLGGRVNSEHVRSGGLLTERSAKEFYVDKAFIAVDGLDVMTGLTSYDLEKCLLTKIVLQHAKQSFILADHSKLGITANYKMGVIADAHAIISNSAAPATIERHCVQWIQCTP